VNEFDLADRVEDRDDADPNTAVVVGLPNATADEWDATERKTVAEFPGNEEYPDDAPVVVVVFEDELADAGFGRYVGAGPLDLAALDEKGVDYYAFPAPRLEVVDPAPEVDEDLVAIADRLRDGGMTVAFDAEEGIVRAEKLGEEYVVDTDGVVEGGSLRDRVDDVVAEVTA